MSNIGSTGTNVPYLPASPLNRKDGPDTGSAGRVKGGATAPDAPAASTLAAVASLSSMFASPSLQPKRTGDVELVLAEVSAKLSATREDNELEGVKANQEKVRASREDNQVRAEERERKLEEAAAAAKANPIAKFFQRLFQAIAAALTFIAAALVAAVPGGQVIAGLMIAGGVMQVMQLANDVTKDISTAVNGDGKGFGIAGGIAKAAGADAETVQKIDAAATYAMMGVSLALSIATIAAGNFSGLKDAIQLATKVTDAVSAANQAASGSLQIATSAQEYKGAKLSAEATQLSAKTEKLGAEGDYLQDMMDEALKRLMKAGEASSAILDAAMQSLNERGQSLSRVNFRG